ncbi:NADH pyrophosphatase [Pestalotiopsis sp. IQ-011]
MSSTTGLSRTRSLRQPAATSSRNQLSQRDATSNASESGSSSPSRLPQVKPLTRSGTVTSATTSSSTTAAARSRAASSATRMNNTPTTASGRPLSGIFSSKPITSSTTTATRQRAPTGPDNATARPLGRAPSIRQVPGQQPTATTTTSSTSRRVPSTSSISSSSSSARRPTSSGGLPSSAAPRSKPATHSRAKSTATALTAATTLRPPASSSTPSGAASPSAASTTRLHARKVSQTQQNAAAAAAAAMPPPPIPPQSPAHRPAFNTNQQHYSPLKSHAPKPLTSTFLAPPSPSKLPSNVAMSAETSRLQTELLQLSLLHREAGAVTRAWHASARWKLRARFGEAAAEHERICARERDGVEARNVAALLRWGSTSGMGLEDKLQALDQVLDGVWAMSEPEGRYSRVAEGFEAWAGRMADVMAKRRSGRADDLVRGGEVLFVSDLDARWRDECAGLVRKLEAWCLMLNEIGPAPEDENEEAPRSSLSRILEGCTSLVVGMLAELEVMLDIERDARRAEDDWIERMSQQLRIGDHETMDREPPLWKMVI